MASSDSPILITSATVAVSTTAVAPGTAIPDNCRSILIFSTSALIWGIASAGAGTLTLGTNAFLLPANTPLTLGIGTIQERGDMATAGKGIVYAGSAGSTPTVYIAYNCVFG